MDDIRWFSPNHYCALPVPSLREAGLAIALDGDAPARLAVAMDAPCAVDGFHFSIRHRCPLVLNLADLPPWRLGSGRPDLVFELAGRVRRIPRLGGRYPKRPGYYSRIRFVARRAREVWGPSENTVRDIRARFGVTARHVPFCYDSHQFHETTNQRPPRPGLPPSVLSVSRLVPHKNHAAILRAVTRLPDRPVVTILGDGPEAEPLRTLARRLGVPLVLPGSWASDQEILDAYRDARVLVAPSSFEGFGLTPMEGLAMGVPVIASDIPPHREFLGDAVRYFPPDDDAALARELTAVLTAPTDRRSAGPPVLTDLTIEACARRLLPLLERLLGSPA